MSPWLNLTNDLSEPYSNLGKILVRSLWLNLTNNLSEPYGNLGKILVRLVWLNLTNNLSELYGNLGKILVRSLCVYYVKSVNMSRSFMCLYICMCTMLRVLICQGVYYFLCL